MKQFEILYYSDDGNAMPDKVLITSQSPRDVQLNEQDMAEQFFKNMYPDYSITSIIEVTGE